MSKLLCLCGNTIDLSPHPNQHEFHLFPEALLEKSLREIALEFGQAHSAKEFEKRLYAIVFRGSVAPYVVNECPICGRLYIFDPSIENPPILRYGREESSEPTRFLHSFGSTELSGD